MDITAFYDSEDHRDYVKTPHNMDGRTFATNGRVLISVPLQGDFPAVSKELAPDFKRILGGADGANFKTYQMPKNIIGKICKRCKGFGKTFMETCEECGGEGEVEFWNGHHSYEFECATCDGRGEVSCSSSSGDLCLECMGYGIIYPPLKFKDGFSRGNFKYKYIKTISKIPGLKIFIHPEGKLYFIGNDNINGVIMGLHE